ERRRQHRREQALPQRAEPARHLEPVDRLDAVDIEARRARSRCSGGEGGGLVGVHRALTSETKMSSSDDCSVWRSLYSTLSSASRRKRPGIPVSSAWASKE